MKKILLATFIFASVFVMAGCSKRDSVDETPARVTAADVTQQKTEVRPAILGEIDKLHEQCPQTMSGLQEGLPGCEEKLKKMIEATRMGWCWGEAKIVDGREEHWQLCEQDPAEVVAATRANEVEKRVLDACTATPVNIKPASVEVLAGLQEQMRCLENFLSDNTGHWKQAYADRSKVMLDSMTVIEALNEPQSGGAGSDISNAQRTLIGREKFNKLKRENYHYVKRAINEITTSITYSLFRYLKESGVEMGNPKEDIEASNRQAKQTGVWGSTIDSASDDGEFVVTRWVTETAPMFKIAGYGSVSIITKIEDNYFDNNGAFSDKCKVYLGVTQTRLSYDCADYLAALNGDEVVQTMNSVISEDMAKKANRTN